MDSKNQKIKRPKRQQKVIEDYWDCSVCTFRNTAEAFKCLMCDVRKGKVEIFAKTSAVKLLWACCLCLVNQMNQEFRDSVPIKSWENPEKLGEIICSGRRKIVASVLVSERLANRNRYLYGSCRQTITIVTITHRCSHFRHFNPQAATQLGAGERAADSTARIQQPP